MKKKVAALVYKCSKCDARMQKLWRQYNTVLDAVDLLCMNCALADQKKDDDCSFTKGESDQIGWLVPAVPTELPNQDGCIPKDASYWGYSSVPDWGVKWWYDLPPVIPRPHPETRRKMLTREEEEAAAQARRDEWDRQTNEKIEKTVFVVEATHNETHGFWERWHTVLSYVQDSAGLAQQIGTFHDHPVYVTVFWYVIEGKYVAFYEATSRVVDHDMVEKWVEKTFPVVRRNRRKGQTVTCDSSNFHHCLHAIAPKWGDDPVAHAQYERINNLLMGRSR